MVRVEQVVYRMEEIGIRTDCREANRAGCEVYLERYTTFKSVEEERELFLRRQLQDDRQYH